MGDDLDRRVRQLVHEMAESAPAPPDWSSISTTVVSEVSPLPEDESRRRRRPVVLVAAAAAVVVAAGVSVLVLTQGGVSPSDDGDDEPRVTRPPPTVPAIVPTSASPPERTTTTAAPQLDCSETPEVIVRTLMRHRVAGDSSTPPCLAVEGLFGSEPLQPPCWSRCGDGRRVVDFELQEVAHEWVSPAAGSSGWSIGAAIEYETVDGRVERSIEDWELTDRRRGVLRVTSLDVIDTEVAEIDATLAVSQYLDALAAGRYEEAAGLLGQGGLNWEQRFDLADFPEMPVDGEELAAALRDWCRSGAVCHQPASLKSKPLIGGLSAEVTAVFEVEGEEVVGVFTGSNYEGAPAVTGLPPFAPD